MKNYTSIELGNDFLPENDAFHVLPISNRMYSFGNENEVDEIQSRSARKMFMEREIT